MYYYLIDVTCCKHPDRSPIFLMSVCTTQFKSGYNILQGTSPEQYVAMIFCPSLDAAGHKQYTIIISIRRLVKAGCWFSIPGDLTAGWRPSRSLDGYTYTAGLLCGFCANDSRFTWEFVFPSENSIIVKGANEGWGDGKATCDAAVGGWVAWRSSGSKSRCRVSLRCGSARVGPNNWCSQTTSSSADTYGVWIQYGFCMERKAGGGEKRERGRVVRPVAVAPSLQEDSIGISGHATRYASSFRVTRSFHSILSIVHTPPELIRV